MGVLFREQTLTERLLCAFMCGGETQTMSGLPQMAVSRRNVPRDCNHGAKGHLMSVQAALGAQREGAGL